MDDDITVRFTEYSRYDPQSDSERIRLMAITNRGTYHADVPFEAPKPLRLRRIAFRDRVMELIDEGQPPCEVSL